MKRLVVIGAMALATAACGNPQASGTSSERSGIYFVPRTALSALTSDGMEVVGTHDSGLLVKAPESLEAEILGASPQGYRFDQSAREFTAYSFPTMETKLRQLAAAYPEMTTLETYGTSVQGRAEYVLTVGKKSDATPKPELMITAATHGNEIITVDVLLGLIEKLLAGYGPDPRITAMLDNHTIHFIPAVCVDSYVAQTRANEGRDPNRDYPWPDEPVRSPVGCIKDVMAFFDAHPIVGSMDYHSAASMIMFPWAYTYSRIPAADYAKLNELTTRMARVNHYEHGDIASTIYIAEGSSADYYYWQKHTMATAVELSHNFAVGVGAAADLVQENTESTWTFIEDFH